MVEGPAPSTNRSHLRFALVLTYMEHCRKANSFRLRARPSDGAGGKAWRGMSALGGNRKLALLEEHPQRPWKAEKAERQCYHRHGKRVASSRVLNGKPDAVGESRAEHTVAEEEKRNDENHPTECRDKQQNDYAIANTSSEAAAHSFIFAKCADVCNGWKADISASPSFW